MGNDSRDAIVRIGSAAVVLRHGSHTSRLQVHTATFSVLRGRRPVRLRLEGPEGSVTVELSRIAFWRLTAEFHEQAIGADAPLPEQPAQRARRSRS